MRVLAFHMTLKKVILGRMHRNPETNEFTPEKKWGFQGWTEISFPDFGGRNVAGYNLTFLPWSFGCRCLISHRCSLESRIRICDEWWICSFPSNFPILSSLPHFMNFKSFLDRNKTASKSLWDFLLMMHLPYDYQMMSGHSIKCPKRHRAETSNPFARLNQILIS